MQVLNSAELKMVAGGYTPATFTAEEDAIVFNITGDSIADFRQWAVDYNQSARDCDGEVRYFLALAYARMSRRVN